MYRLVVMQLAVVRLVRHLVAGPAIKLEMIYPPRLLLRRDLVVLRELMHRDGCSGGGSPAPRGPEAVACFQGMPGHRN